MIDDINYKLYLNQKLEREIETVLKKQFHKDFRISISADADILTEEKLDDYEKKEILRFVSAYLLDFDSQFTHS